MTRLKIPMLFFIDHMERDLPTPAIISENSSQFVIDSGDPALRDLISDAKHYAHSGTDAPGNIIKGARMLLAALERQNVYVGD